MNNIVFGIFIILLTAWVGAYLYSIIPNDHWVLFPFWITGLVVAGFGYIVAVIGFVRNC